MYMLTIVLVLLVQFMRGLPCTFGLAPSFLRASNALHLHQMVVFLEGFGSVLGRAVAFATYLGSKAFLLARFSSRLDRESTTASSMTNLFFRSSAELSLGGDSILLALIGLIVCFLAHFMFCKLVDRCWWHSTRSAAVHASREEEPTDNCNSSSSSVFEPHVLGQAMNVWSNDEGSGGAVAQPELPARPPALLCEGFCDSKTCNGKLHITEVALHVSGKCVLLRDATYSGLFFCISSFRLGLLGYLGTHWQEDVYDARA